MYSQELRNSRTRSVPAGLPGEPFRQTLARRYSGCSRMRGRPQPLAGAFLAGLNQPQRFGQGTTVPFGISTR